MNNQKKYEVIKKICPICSIEFETKQGSRDEKTTCSRACSNSYFQHGINNPNFDKEKYKNRCLKVSKKLTKGFEKINEEEIKILYYKIGSFEKVSNQLGLSIQTIKNVVNLVPKELVYKTKEELEILSNRKCLNCENKIPLVNTKFCSMSCFTGFYKKNVYEKYIEDWKNGLVDGGKGIEGGHNGVSGHIRRYLFDKYESKCALCGWDKSNPFTKTQPLEVDHIDGDSLNNKEDNLILLCPNCHSLTPGHSTSKGNGRRYYRQKYRDEKGLDIKE